MIPCGSTRTMFFFIPTHEAKKKKKEQISPLIFTLWPVLPAQLSRVSRNPLLGWLLTLNDS